MIRCLTISFSLLLIFIILGIQLPKARSETFRHHEAHEHSVARMNVCIEGRYLYIEIISPAAIMVGFEHTPRNTEQKTVVEMAEKSLKMGDKLFILSPGVGGRLVECKVETDMWGQFRHAHIDERSQDKYHKEGPGKTTKADRHPNDKLKTEENGRHSEFRAYYRINCKKPEKLASLDVMLFHFFPGIKHIEGQLITEKKQTAFELTAKDNQIRF